MKTIIRIFISMLLFLSLGGISAVHASPVTLSDANSQAMIDPDSQAGMYSWMVDGSNIMYQQWFWYRIGNSGREYSIDSISLPTVVQNAPNATTISYTLAGMFQIDINYLLIGGTQGSGTSDIAETIRIRNLGTTALNFHFFQYSDFDLGDPDNDTVEIVGPNVARQSDPNYNLTETVVVPGANRYEANIYAATLNSLNDGVVTNLNNVKGPITGDATWAYQWDKVIAARGAFIISKDKNIQPVPEPTTLLLLGLGLVGIGLARRKK